MSLDTVAPAPRPEGETGTGLFPGGLGPQPADSLLALIGAFRADRRAGKIDVGVGVYRDPQGRTPVLRAVKEAERRLVAGQETKAYLGPEGDAGFFEALKPIIFGDADHGARLVGLQTPGGTGALRLAAELIARFNPQARIWVGEPTWPNHHPILQAAGLEIMAYQHFDVATQRLTFARALDALSRARRGDVALLHGCCHNPVGADFDMTQWRELAQLMRERGVLPLIDLAYQGLGRGLDEDAAGARILLETVGEGLLAYSCDKNFGLYRERVGALYALAGEAAAAGVVQSNLLALARANWSMPPDHGAAIVRVILSDPALAADWRTELAEMRDRIRGIRALLADADPRLAPLRGQQGMFSTLPLTPQQVARLRDERGIYMPASGRINLAGLTAETIPTFVDALASLR
ncbi:amino acid aminotransferase [Rhizorhabdus dicambivorans]|uniref:Aspartate/tyrosine/aromatic aminotransferase n=1 Tax=Rhizorhabdus dicambivorans TaxID=1850238 RepID=A0A2A4FSW6_9SPHN|nr:amino acid aminotransferase [Rhizorhabdus dicambivorans]ATE64650.1 aspartate/tyrosine/aromatic aminotransferase [Rhizorhabdus dicambivorans]PCE40772.1 aspartate/tyrosine/aromatic aminotransferase [Rhizorhabdus dicambivorans]